MMQHAKNFQLYCTKKNTVCSMTRKLKLIRLYIKLCVNNFILDLKIHLYTSTTSEKGLN